MTKGITKSKSGSPRRASKPRGSNATSQSPVKKPATAKSAAHLIDARIRSLGGWRAKTLAEVRRLVHQADPEILEECKWVKPSNPMGVPVWSHAGIVCTGEAYKQVVKLTFARGASLQDPHGLFNSSLAGTTRRAIDIREGQSLDPDAFKSLIRAAIRENLQAKDSTSNPRAKPAPQARRSAKPKSVTTIKRTTKPRPAAKVKPVRLLTGGNPQIAKADGDEAVQAYIAAMPGWKRELGKRLDALIVRSVPQVRKAVKWNSPFYGLDGQGWFLSFHVFTHYVKVTFFHGLSLRPLPPGGTPKSKDARWIDIREGDSLDVATFTSWVKQAAALPGWLS
jgi:hypothetical protein